MVMKTWVVVLIKDFDTAKQRLQPAMGAKSRRALARRNARRAVEAAAGGDRGLVVAGGAGVAEMAAGRGAEGLGGPREGGQDGGARGGVKRGGGEGAEAGPIPSSGLALG